MTQEAEPSTTPPQPTVPVCYRHPNIETYVRCVRCNRPICPNCMREASVGFQCPECVSEGRRSVRQTRTIFGGSLAGARGHVTMTLIAINVVMMVVSIISAGGRGIFGGGFGGLLGSGTPLTEWGAIAGQRVYEFQTTGLRFAVPYGIADGEYWRLFTAMFLHYGILHLLVNMYALWILGRSLEGALGRTRFLLLYLVSGVGSGVMAYVISPSSQTAGASGAIFGLFAALFIILKRLGRDTSSVVPILIINIAISFAPGISLAGHLGGLLTGAAIAAALAYAPSGRRNFAVAATVVTVLVLMVAAVAIKTPAIQHTPLPPGVSTSDLPG